VEELFSHCEPQVRELYDLFVALVKNVGPVRVIPQKSRIAFQVRMRFAVFFASRTVSGVRSIFASGRIRR